MSTRKIELKVLSEILDFEKDTLNFMVDHYGVDSPYTLIQSTRVDILLNKLQTLKNILKGELQNGING